MNAAAHFRIPALSSGIEVKDFDAWLRFSSAGDRIEYATGPIEPRSLPIWKRVQDAAASGDVAPLRVRRAGGGWQWLAERKTGRRVAEESVPGDCAADQERLLRLLRRCANMAMACPTNAEAAELLGLKNADRVRYLIRKLVEGRHIAVIDNGPNERRVIRILANGKSTIGGAR